ncbi:MAG: hypothetical protein J1F41_08700, partial [Lachnospiraceae bacterium]|nr:hypothetical protein [Lachnospiraceae bacterium]
LCMQRNGDFFITCKKEIFLMENEQLLQAITEVIQHNLIPINSRLDGIDGRLDRIDIRLDRLESDVSALKAGHIAMRNDIRNLEIKVDMTYQLALDAWGKSTENRQWLENKQVPV